MKSEKQYIPEARMVQLVLLDLICAISEIAAAHEGDLPETYERLLKQYESSKVILKRYLEKSEA